MKIRVRGIEYHFETHQKVDELPSLVLLHGFLGSGKSFASLIPELKNFCNPVTIDLLGHGGTEGSEMHYRFAGKEQAADLVKLISEQLHSPLFIYGYSMGGRLALQIALQRPDLLQGLILESTTFGIENDQERQARQALDAQRADSISGNFNQFLDEWAEMPLFLSDQVSKAELAKIRKIQQKQNALWMSNSLLGFGTGNMPCFKEQLHHLSMPVQLIAGGKDQKFINLMSAMHHRMQSSQFSVFQNASHRVHLEQMEQIARTLKKFIQTHTLP